VLGNVLSQAGEDEAARQWLEKAGDLTSAKAGLAVIDAYDDPTIGHPTFTASSKIAAIAARAAMDRLRRRSAKRK
jgi:hypothetical protein